MLRGGPHRHCWWMFTGKLCDTHIYQPLHAFKRSTIISSFKNDRGVRGKRRIRKITPLLWKHQMQVYIDVSFKGIEVLLVQSFWQEECFDTSCPRKKFPLNMSPSLFLINTPFGGKDLYTYITHTVSPGRASVHPIPCSGWGSYKWVPGVRQKSRQHCFEKKKLPWLSI